MTKSISRRSFLAAGAASAALATTGVSRLACGMAAGDACPTAKDTFALLKSGKKIPVVLDTDIGGDIDDTWALAMMLRSPEFDVKLITSDSGNDIYRARLIAKLLEVAGRTDIPVGIGVRPADNPGRQSAWLGDYDLKKYPGKVHEDGVGAIADVIQAADEPMTLICIGPVPNMTDLLRRAPDVVKKARFVGMHGSVRMGYGGSEKISPEYNVRADPEGLQKTFAAPWDITITPLDTCGIVHLEGERFQKVYRSKDPLIEALMANYQAWRAAHAKKSIRAMDVPDRSSTLFDTVAIYLALSEKLLEMEQLPLVVTDDGYTRIDPAGRPVHCAMKWKDLDAFKDDLVERLVSEG